MKMLKKISLFLFGILLGIQFIPTTRNQSKEVLATDFNKVFSVPDEVQSLLQSSCYDCHSNATNYPWYDKIQPVSWFLEHHIEEAKAELNFNEFGDYSIKKQKHKLKERIHEIKDNEMPLSSYTLMHGEAKLSQSDKTLLENWLTDLRDGL